MSPLDVAASPFLGSTASGYCYYYVWIAFARFTLCHYLEQIKIELYSESLIVSLIFIYRKISGYRLF